MVSESRYIGVFPALPLDRNLEFGEWIVGTPPPDSLWASPRFRELSEMLFRSFEKRGFTGGAWLWHRERGFDGSRPSDDEIGAIGAAVTFAALDANDRLPEVDDGDVGRYLTTTENAELFLQPIDEKNGRIVHERGGLLKSTYVLGVKIGDEPPPFADAVEPISEPVAVSSKLARAVFEAIRCAGGSGPAIAAACYWHRAALVNPSAVTQAQRLILLKIGFETIFRTSESWLCARQLRELFETVTAAHRNLLPWRGLLWSPAERTDLARSYEIRKGKNKGQKVPVKRSELEDWFSAFAEARNQIVHYGRLATEIYPAPDEHPMSRYAGWLIKKGERILREAIKATLGPDILLSALIAQRTIDDLAIDDLRQFQSSLLADKKVPSTVSPSAPTPEPPPRSLEALLADLGCPPNHVVVEASPALGATRRAKRPDGSGWGDIEFDMVITQAERDLLVHAGAEEELSNHWMPYE